MNKCMKTWWNASKQSGVAIGLLALVFGGCSEPSAPLPVQSTGWSNSDSASFYNERIVQDAEDPSRYVDRAAWHLRSGRVTEGLDDLNLALKADSNHAPAWSAKADALYLTQAFEPCVDHLEACLEVAPTHIPCLLRRAEMHIHLRQYPMAFERINDVLKQDPLNHEGYWMKGMIYQEQGNASNAKSSFQTAVEVEPDFFDGYIALGLTYAQENDTLAIGYYTTAMELNPRSVEAKYNLAYFLQEHRPITRSYLDRSLRLYREIRALDAGNATAAFNQGYIHLEYLQQYDSATVHFTQAIEALPYYHQAFYNRGLAWESLGDAAQAELDYREALRYKPDYTSAALALERVLRP
jgi:tetratricopeptide (TPR) repeat protein